VLAAAGGKLIVEMSVAGPLLVSELATEVEAAGARMVDAPLLGAPDAVRAGAAVILAGGSAEDVQRATPILSRLGTVRCVGPLGSAARLRLLANNMLADIALAAAELRVGGDWAGLAPDDIYWVLQRLAPPLVTRLDPLLSGAG
jgi:3-hydroxyisobutyrate dehydrogenase-like beta-hydroxyacid dehydrogenase